MTEHEEWEQIKTQSAKLIEMTQKVISKAKLEVVKQKTIKSLTPPAAVK